MKEKIFKKRIKQMLISVVLALAMVFSVMSMNSLTVYAASYTTTSLWFFGGNWTSQQSGNTPLVVGDTVNRCRNGETSANHKLYFDGALKTDTSWNITGVVVRIDSDLYICSASDHETKKNATSGLCSTCNPHKHGNFQTEWIQGTNGHWHACGNSDCDITESDVTSHTEDGFAYAAHDGTATCQAKAKCSVCQAEYGEKSSENHTGTETTWTATETTHKETYDCCGAVKTAETNHGNWEEGKCVDCAYACQHLEYNEENNCVVCGMAKPAVTINVVTVIRTIVTGVVASITAIFSVLYWVGRIFG